MSRVSRRAALLWVVALIAPITLAQSYTQGGYADRHSVAAGGTIAFHIATSSSPFNVQIINLATPQTVLQTITGLVSQPRNCSGMWENGCAWPVTTVYTVPSNFTPGYYVARFPTSSGNRNILFVVRPAVLGSYAPIAVIQPSNTDVAYNRFGGKSVYDTISDNGQRAHIVSFNRPYYDDAGLARFNRWEAQFVAWMQAEGRKFEVLTDDDMEAGIPLAAYKALVIVGHSEYWSLNARRHLEDYSRSGGHVAIFGANTMWWQVRIDLESRKMTVYKDAALDPLNGVNNDVVTTNWFDWPVLNPENTILGASFLNAAYVNKLNSSDPLPLEERTPYTVRKANHWAFAGTGLTNGAEMGRAVGAIEVDGALFNTLPTNEVQTEGSDGTPLSYEVLATLPASDGYATIGFHANAQGGGVFNGAARDWSHGLSGPLSDPVVQQITRNVLDRVATGAPFAYQPRSTPNRAEELFNTPRAAADFLYGWRFHRFGLDLTSRCAREGPTGLELTGPRWTLVMRHLAVGRTGLSKGAANVWINADLITQSPNYATALVGFVDYRGPARPYVAALEWMRRAQGPSVRMTSFDGTAPVASTNWVTLTPGWHSVQFAWESPGTLQLNVSGQKVSTFNSKSGQRMNALMFEFAGSVSTGSICADQLQFRDLFAPPSPATSTITASPQTIPVGGTSGIIVRLLDADGNPIVNGGDAVTLSTTHGSLSPVADVGDGTYTATLTAGPTGGTATISATVNSQSLAQTATVIVIPPPPPAPPSGLTATAASPTRIDLSWTDNSDDETGFRIERCTGGGCSSFGSRGTTAANATSFADTAVAGGTTYVYRVIAVNGNGDSSPSNSATATTPTPCVPPAISTQPQSTTITSGSSTTLTVTATGSAPLAYQWYAGTTPIGGATRPSVTVSPTTTTSYFVRVIASCGSTDSSTATVTVTPAGPTGSSFYVLTPCRVIDSRGAIGPRGGPALGSGQTRVVQMSGTCGIPGGATAVATNVTAVGPSAAGFLAFYPTGTAWPGTITVAYRTGKTRATSAIVALNANGQATLLNEGATQNFIVDVTGYFR